MINRAQITGPLGWSVAAILIAAVVVLPQVPPLLKAVITSGAPEKDAAARKIQQVVQTNFNDLHAAYKDRFNGRFLFFPPKAPLQSKPEPTHVATAPSTPPPPPAPSTYGGPAMLYPFGEVVWFKDSSNPPFTLSPGQEKNGVTLISISAPWSVRVKWSDLEWDIELFKDWKKPEELLREFEKSGSQPAGPVPGINEVPQDRPQVIPASDPATAEPRPDEQPQTTGQPSRNAAPAAGNSAPTSRTEQAGGAP